MDPTLPSGMTRRRVELRIRRPLVTWFARPTVVVDGVAHPAQWGTGTWAVADEGGTEIGVYLYNRLWRWGAAAVGIGAATAGREVIEYRVGLLPVGGARMTHRSS